LDYAEAQGLDLGFVEASTNWDKALADIQDDTLFWNTGVMGDITGGFL